MKPRGLPPSFSPTPTSGLRPEELVEQLSIEEFTAPLTSGLRPEIQHSAEEFTAPLTSGLRPEEEIQLSAEELLAPLTSGLRPEEEIQLSAEELLAPLTSGLRPDEEIQLTAEELLAPLTSGLRPDEEIQLTADELLASPTGQVNTDEDMDTSAADPPADQMEIDNTDAPVDTTTDWAIIMEETEECVVDTHENSPVEEDTTTTETVPSSETMEHENIQDLPAHSDRHPFQKHYLHDESDLPEEPAERISASTTLKMIQDFRNESLKWMSKDTEVATMQNGKRNPNLNTISQFDCEETFALYIIRDSAGGNLRLTPAHRELVADDRPDLYLVHLTRHSTDVLNPGPPHPANFYAGDVIVVFSLKKRPGATTEQLKRDFAGITNMQNHNFWHVRKFALIKRRISTNQALWRIDNEDSRWAQESHRSHHGKQGAQPRKFSCIGYDQNRIVEAKPALYNGIPPNDQRCTVADILLPVLEPAHTLRSLLRGESRHAVITATRVQPPTVPLKPSVIAIFPLPQKFQEYIALAPNAFRGRNPDYRIGGNAILWTARFGLAATLAIANKNKDTHVYSTTIDATEKAGRALKVTFNIQGTSGPAPITAWARSTTFYMELPKYGNLQLEVEDSVLENRHLTLTAKFSWESQDRLQGKLPFGQHAGVWQELDDNVHQLRTFPEPSDWAASNSDSPANNCLIAVTGGPPVTRCSPNGQADAAVEFSGSSMVLSREQSIYANIVARSPTIGLIANAPPGVGKTVMVAGTTIHTIRSGNDTKATHLLTGITNVCILPLVKALKNLDPLNTCPPVRLISEVHRERLDPALRTDIDYPVLWVSHFTNLLRRVNPSATPMEIDANNDLVSAIQHLHAKKVDPNQFAHPHVRKGVNKGVGHARNIIARADLFRKLYRPRIFLGTVASVLDAFNTPEWITERETIKTIQADEASQLPLYAFTALALTFGRARIALVGDIRQLPPFEDPDLPRDLAAFASSRILTSATRTKALPVIDLIVGRRCPPPITKIYNELFYSKKLEAMWSRTNEAELRSFAEALHFPTAFPLQILDLPSTHSQSGTSLVNRGEALAAVRIVNTIRERTGTTNIGVLCFYKAQAGLVSTLLGDSPFYVGTIDGSQGHEFKVVVVLTTRTSPFRNCPFLEDDNRINVAISRTKRICCVLLDTAHASPRGAWSGIIHRIPTSARTNCVATSRSWIN